MGNVNENIRVRIDAALNGLPVFQQFSAVLEKIKSQSGQKIQVGDAASIAQTNQLATSIDNLGKKIESLQPSKLAELSTIIQGIAASSTFVRNIVENFGGLEKILTTVKSKATEVVDGVVTRAGPIIESITSKVASLGAALPAVGEGGAAAAVGIGALAAGGTVAIGTIVAFTAAIVGLIAIVASITTAIVGFIPVLAHMALRIAETDAVTGKVQDRLRSGEIQAILTELKQRASELADELARELVPAILQLLRVALELVNQLEPALRPFFDFILFNIRVIGNALVWLTTRAISTGKAIAAALAVGYATGSPIEAGKAAISTYNASVADLEKTMNSPVPLGTGVSSGAGPFAGRGGGAGGGGGGGRPPKPEDTSQSQFALDRAVAEARFKQISESLDRENKLITEKYNERKVTIADYYADVLQIEDEKLQAEEIKLVKELNAQQFQLAHALQKIDADRASGAIRSDAEAEAKKTNELNRAQERSVQLNSEINSIRQKRLQLAHDIGEKEKADTDALNARLQQQIDAMDRLRGLGPLVEARRAIGEIDELIKEFSGDEGMVRFLEEWRDVVGAIGQADAAITRYQKAQELTEEKIATLQERGSRNVLARFINEEKIRRLRQQELKDLQEMLKTLEAIAKVSNNAEVQVKIQQTKTKIEELKNQTHSFKDTFRDTFIDSAAGALENFFTSLGDVISGTKKLSDAFREMALSIIKDLEQIIAKQLVMLILQKLLGMFGGGVTGAGGPLQGVTGAAGGGGFAAGDFVPARSGGRIIQVAEGGYDEVVMTTDPRHRRRTGNLLASFLQRTGLLQGFDVGGWISAASRFDIPSFDAGGWIGAPALAGGGGTVNMGGVHFHGVSDYRQFKQNQAAIERDLTRAARRGADHFRK